MSLWYAVVSPPSGGKGGRWGEINYQKQTAGVHQQWHLRHTPNNLTDHMLPLQTIITPCRAKEIPVPQYVDDLLLYSPWLTHSQHHTTQLLNFLADRGNPVSPTKVQLSLPRVIYLGVLSTPTKRYITTNRKSLISTLPFPISSVITYFSAQSGFCIFVLLSCFIGCQPFP